MAEYLSPGVYIEEFEIGARPIEGVSTSTGGFLGETERGPIQPQLVTSWQDYKNKYGEYFKFDGTEQYLPYAVEGFFINGGQRCYIGRITREDATEATGSLSYRVETLTVKAVGGGSWGNQLAIQIDKGSHSGFKLTVYYWGTELSESIPLERTEFNSFLTSNPATETEVHDDLSVNPGDTDYYGEKLKSRFVSLEPAQKPDTIPGDVFPAVQLTGGTNNQATEATGVLVKTTQDAAGNDIKENIIRADAVRTGDWGNRIAVEVGNPDTTDKTFDLKIHYWTGQRFPSRWSDISPEMLSHPADSEEFTGLSLESTNPKFIEGISSKYVTLRALVSEEEKIPDETTPADIETYCTLTGGNDGTKDPASGKLLAEVSGALTVETIGPVDSGNRVAVAVKKGSLSKEDPRTYFRLQVFYWSKPMANSDPPKDAAGFKSLLKNHPPQYTEDFDDLSVDPKSPDFYETKVTSNLIKVFKDENDTGEIPADTASCIFLGGGSIDKNTPLTLARWQNPGEDKPGERGGLDAFKEVDEIAIVYAPNATTDKALVKALVNKIIEHCESLKDRFAIIDSKKDEKTFDNLKPRDDWATKYAAFYYPWIKITDPVNGSKKTIPPGGYIAGIYARSDTERGVHKAPANEKVRGAVDVEFPITKGDQDILNPRGVNCIRAFPGRGILVWGGRTLSDNSLWKYVNVRRLFNYIEESIEEGTQWVVFEPNDEKLWARVRATITQFLTDTWRSGALMGKKAEEAFFVKCDRSTMSQGDIDNGRLICIIGIAPVKPAEFVIFRVAQWQGGSAVTE